MLSPVRLAALFAGGAIGLSACNEIHVLTGVLRYPSPGLPPAWVPVVFGAAAVACYLGALPFAPRVNRSGEAALVTGALWFVGAYAATGALARWPLALAIGLLVAWIARVARRPDRLVVIGYSLALAAAGVVVEGAISATGAFAYARHDLWLTPIWLSGLYLHGAPLALALAKRLGAGAPSGPHAEHQVA